MGPLVGMLMAGGASGIFGGAGGGGLMGGLMSSLMKGGGLGGLLSNLMGGGQSGGAGAGAAPGNDQTNQLLGDIKGMLNELLDKEGGSGAGAAGGGDRAGGSHGVPEGGCHRAPGGDEGHGCSSKPPSCGDDHGCDGADEPDCGGADHHGCDDADEPECGGADHHGCDDADEPECGGAEEHGCDGADGPEWDGADKSPSLDRERGASRLLEQARNTEDPGEKRELIDMAMDMLGDGPKEAKGFAGERINDMRQKQDGNSYDKDIVKQADKMLDQIDEGHLSDCNESKALDSVIDMLTEEGGVDGMPASNDVDGNGREEPRYQPVKGILGHAVAAHQHLHSALFDHRH